jgi:hypothetical protein
MFIPEFRDGDLKCRFPDILYVTLNDLLRVCLSEFYDRKTHRTYPRTVRGVNRGQQVFLACLTCSEFCTCCVTGMGPGVA